MNPETAPPSSRPAFWTRHLRRELQFLLDLLVLAAAFWIAYLLRFDFALPEGQLQRALGQMPLVVLLQFATVFLVGIYSFVWRYVGLVEIRAFLRGAVYSGGLLTLMRFGLPESLEQWRLPLSVIVLDTGLAFGGLLGLRVLRRILYERYESHRRRREAPDRRRRPVLFAGAGRAGVLAAREVLARGDLDLEPMGFVDDDPRKQGSVIQGLKVLGTTEEIPDLARRLRLDRVVITIAEAPPGTIRRIYRTCESSGLKVQIIPGLYEILQGRISFSRFRDVQIEDLLGRETVHLDEDEVRRFLTGRPALVTGAGGSIGSELARQMARFAPRRLILVDRSETALFEIEREIAEVWPQLALEAALADVGDPHRMRALLERFEPSVVFHAAALKHVPMMERDVTEAIRTNVLATARLARLAAERGVDAFVLISSDKAVKPSSIMGASKRVAELVIQHLDQQFADCRLLAVRFGNVLGSSGSVVPIFRRQIQKGGPVTVTDPEATRYFMTLSEAAQLVLEAGALGQGGEIMILDMGEPIRILDLAEDMIRLSGFEPYSEIPILFTGLRPGEKLFEELELSGEGAARTRHPKIFVGRLEPMPAERLLPGLERLARRVDRGEEEGIRALLAELLPESELEGVDRRWDEPLAAEASGEVVG